MPVFTPDSTVYLLNSPLETSLRSTLWFPNRTTQADYFRTRVGVVITNENYNYIKKDSTLVVQYNADQIWRYNYMMYRNSNFTDKWFYAFVTKIEWASNNSARLHFQTDPLQTWMFDWQLYTSYIDRQHSTTDNAGDNIQPEPFSVSRTKYQAAGSIDCKPNWLQVYATARSSGTPKVGEMAGGIYSASGLVWNGNLDSNDPSADLQEYVNNGTATAVSRVQQVTTAGTSSQPQHSYQFDYPKYPTTIDGYTPKNQKLKSGAFVHGYAAGFGQKLEFIPEFCIGNGSTIKLIQDFTTGSLYFYVPDDGMSEEGIDNVSTGFSVTIPESTWAYNQYKNDYNLHSGSNSLMVRRLRDQKDLGAMTSAIGIAESVAAGVDAGIQTAQSLATMGIAGGTNISGMLSSVSSGLTNTAQLTQYAGGYDDISQQLQTIAEDYSAPAVGGVAASNAFIASGQWYVKYGWEVPDHRFAKVYDDFMTVYGYAQNAYAIPNLHARKSWTYIKVSELMFDVNAPHSDIAKIKKAFENGIFFWDYTKTYGDFSQDNSIV